MKYLQALFFLPLLVFSCGPSDQSGDPATPPQSMVADPQTESTIAEGKGVGEIEEVKLTEPLDQDMITTGKAIYQMKCASCHKLTDQRVVGPGWAGITNRRKPEWIMNMITNVDVMLAEDPTAQALLEECLTRMPNQNISIGDARELLEYMRKNDVEKTGERDQAVESS